METLPHTHVPLKVIYVTIVLRILEMMKGRLAILFANDYSESHAETKLYTPSSTESTFRSNRGSFKRFMKKPFFIPTVAILLLLLVGILIFRNAGNSNASTVLGNKDGRIDLKKAAATQKLQKEFSYPLKDDAGKEISKLKYTIDTVEIRDEIIVEGKKATSIKGRTFLVLNLKINNSFNKPLQINARDYIRLTVNNNFNDKLAPDIHNDPVEVQAISTKLTRVAFPINITDKNLILHIGEISGKKEQVKLTVQ